MLALMLGSLTGCAGEPSTRDSADRGDLLRNNLSVAAAALSAGQPEVARRQYAALAQRFEDAPEPFLGLGYIAFGSNDYAGAVRNFAKSATLAGDAASVRAEALLGAGRAELARNRIESARQHFREAQEIGRDLPLAPWIANGVAVAAALDADHDTAETNFREALRRSSEHPRIAANFVRMLIAAGRYDDATGMYTQREPSFWLDDDGPTLSRLIERVRKGPLGRASALVLAPSLTLRLSETGGPAPSEERAGLPLSSGLALRLAIRTVRAESETTPDPVAEPAAEPVAAGSEHVPHTTSPTGLTLAVGQSMRLDLDGDAASVLVADPAVADVQLLSPKMLYVIGKAVGRTSVTVVGNDERVLDRIVSVVLDLVPLRATLAGDPELVNIGARPVARGVALTGEVASTALAERALRLAVAALPKNTFVENELRVSGAQQVNLEVQIAEVQRSVAEDLGINWEAFRIQDGDVLGFRIGRLLPQAFPVSFTGADFPPATVDGQISPGLFFGRDTANTRLGGMIDALAQAGLANVLARPNVTAVSGEPASFFSGGEYPLPTGFDDGVIVFEYKKYGILLDFIPTVIDSGRIVLNVRPEVSEPSLNQSVQVVGVSIPVINVRRAETTVEVGNGESIVIAGLFRNSSNTREAGVPFLKDVPGLGTLFGHRSTRSEELELIVIVTARLVRANRAPEEAQAPAPRRAKGYHY